MVPDRAGEITPLLIFMGVVFFIAAVFQRLLVSRVLRDWRAATLPGLSASTVLHNVIIIAQLRRRNGRPNLTRDR